MFLTARRLNVLCTNLSVLFDQNKLNEHAANLISIQPFGMAFVSRFL